MDELEYKIQEYVSKKDIELVAKMYSRNLTIADDDCFNKYYLISFGDEKDFSISLYCYQDGLSPKVMFLNNKIMVLGFNASVVVVDIANQVIKAIERFSFTIFELIKVQDTILILHDFGVMRVDERLSEIMVHNRREVLLNYCIIGEEIKMEFENEDEYYLNFLTGDVIRK
ncbi:MAG: hypothetical protein OCC45_15730 [Desulfotalea sp.]